MDEEAAHHLRVYSPPTRANRMGIKAYNLFPSDRGKQGPPALRPPLRLMPPHEQDGFSCRIQSCLVPHHPEGESLWTIGCAGWVGSLSRTTGAARRLAGAVVPGLDAVRGRREREQAHHRGGVRRSRHQPPDVLRMAGEGQGAQVHHVAERQPAHPAVRVPALAGLS